jgi:glyoxylate/hydroxypyruvate reductase A
MTLTILMAAGPGNWERYHQPLVDALRGAGIAAQVTQDAAPDTVDFIVYAPTSALQDFTAFTRCRAVLSLWAGVERIVGNQTLTQALCRMVDPAMAEGMREWVLGHVMRHHLGLDRYSHNPGRLWDPICPPLARDRRVAMLGMGELGTACARALQGVGFHVSGWSRNPKSFAGLDCLNGEDGLSKVLADADFVVTLLPRTPQTENLLNAPRLAACKPGAVILNPGRGWLIDDQALLAALDCSQIGHATLDVFRVEPLPDDHPFWTHPRVTVTPHIAADTRPDTAAGVLVENIRRSLAGEALLFQVNRDQGY